MAAATKERKTDIRDGGYLKPPMAAGVKIYKGTVVVRTSAGYARPGRTSTTDKVLGIAQETVDNTSGSNGDKRITVRKTVANLGNSASADALTIADIGNEVYLVDDQTVAKTSDTNARIVAGKLFDLDDRGPWVDFR
ncbi:hypothetical protein [Asticcacaulis sp. YBE204]|uniref:hypothetical protein n=1 Tax=Asticcacaulis sp. YBE204 TaxID=1282363 RepID=UPI0003C3C325|nr:hypothetical protein [Asticcacaulis sp. YBE204]ESQ78505.1 hypothetical protein AEYBE204_13215 [Asticcacaulis sp. YBE204]